MGELLRVNTPSLARIAKEDGILKVRAALTILIADLVESLNVGKTMDDMQIASTVDLIITDPDFKKYKLGHFQLCFDRAKKAKYGKVFDRIDANVIFDFLNQFDRDYTAEVISEREKENHNHKVEVSTPYQSIPNDQLKDLKNYLLRAKFEKTKEEEKAANKAVDLQKVWLSQFDRIERIQELAEKEGLKGRFVRRSGKVMDVHEFVQYKAKQTRKIMDYIESRTKRTALWRSTINFLNANRDNVILSKNVPVQIPGLTQEAWNMFRITLLKLGYLETVGDMVKVTDSIPKGLKVYEFATSEA